MEVINQKKLWIIPLLKGTFDTGGISIKPSGGMEEMNTIWVAQLYLGLMKALALEKLKANVSGVIGLVENMPSGTAQRPGEL